jgi:MOSC domain-containing protein
VVDVQTPDGQTLAIDDPALIEMLRADIDQKHQLTLMQSQRAMTDCRPLSIFRKILEIGGEMPPFLRHSAARS